MSVDDMAHGLMHILRGTAYSLYRVDFLLNNQNTAIDLQIDHPGSRQ